MKQINSVYSKLYGALKMLVKAILILIAILLSPVLLFRHIIPHCYTPQALTEARYRIYTRAAQLAEDYPRQLENTTIYQFPAVVKQITDDFSPSKNQDQDQALKAYFGARLYAELYEIAAELRSVHCLRIFYHNNFVYFFTGARIILPDRPGVAYSVTGEDPNHHFLTLHNNLHLFQHISGKWYASKILYVRLVRDYSPVPSAFGPFDKSTIPPVSLLQAEQKALDPR